MGVGLTISVLTALAPMLFGAPVLASAKLRGAAAPLGDLGIVTSLFLDVGVYLLIIGVVLDLLRALGLGHRARHARRRGSRYESRGTS